MNATSDFKGDSKHEQHFFMPNVVLKEVSILEEVVSLKCLSRVPTDSLSYVIKQLQNLRAHKKAVKVKVSSRDDPGMFFITDCQIRSINLQKELHFVLHIPVQSSIACQAAKIMALSRSVKIEFLIKDEQATEIERLLDILSKQTNRTKQEILQQATAFYSKSAKKYIPGKTDIAQLSEKQKEIVIEKLKRLTSVFNSQ